MGTDYLDLVKLTPLMKLTSGRPEITIGLIDGPLVMNHPDLANENIREVPGKMRGACAQASSATCMHGTFIAGILSGKRNSPAPAICPDCLLLVRPPFLQILYKMYRFQAQHLGNLQKRLLNVLMQASVS